LDEDVVEDTADDQVQENLERKKISFILYIDTFAATYMVE
jgi:hypothetical protein